MSKKTIATYTLGCKVNQYETNAVEEIFTDRGYSLIDFEDKADIYIINTCTVTSMSDKKSRQIIRRAKKINKDAIVVVIGCYAQNDPNSVIEIEDVNLVMGTKDKNKIYEEVEKISITDKVVKVTDIMNELEFENLNIKNYSRNTRAFVKIQDGCDRYCTYCIIPYTRGRIRSRKMQDIIKEVTALAQNGYKEVVLTGIHVASYGKDLKNNEKHLEKRENYTGLLKDSISEIKEEFDTDESFGLDNKTITNKLNQKNVLNLDFDLDYKYDLNEKISLIDVIEEVAKIDKIQRIRTSSVEPIIITDDFLERLTKIDKFCPHFHLSLQSGADETLKRMNRRYDTKQYKDAVDKIRAYFENPAITTDVITGFPGETDEEFKKTYEYLKLINLYEMHIFPFSRRSGTKAYDMPNQVDNNTKHKRSEILIELANKNKKDFEQKLIGKVETVLFEQKVGDYFEGHTKNYVKVHVKTQDDISGQILPVKITTFEDDKLIGEI